MAICKYPFLCIRVYNKTGLYLILVACISCAGVYNNFMDFSKAPKIFCFFEDFGIRKPGRQAHYENEITLHHSDIC